MRRPAFPIFLALALPAMAQDAPQGPNDMRAMSPPGAVAQLAAAQDLFVLGRAAQDPLTVIAAARLSQAIRPRDVSQARESIAAPDATDPPPDAAKGPVETAAMFTEARRLSGQDETLLTLIDEAEAQGERRQTGGASRSLARLEPEASDIWTVPFFGAVPAELAVIGDGDGRLEVTVADDTDTVICAMANGRDRFHCGWIPVRNGEFIITVRNAGPGVEDYWLVTN